MSKNLRILYMGTPEFAVSSLQIIVQAGFTVVGVVTAPDKPSGRGQKLSQSPVKSAALALGIEVLQPTNLKSDDFANDLKRLNPNLGIVVAFRMLPESVWSYPEIGTFNLHGSLLPKYRGAAPINWAIMNGEKKTGVTTFFLKHEIDTGQIIMQDEELISDNDSVGDVYARLMNKGADLVLKTVQAIDNDEISPTDQQGETCEAPKIFRKDCEIDLSKTQQQVHDFIRGLSPYPGAWINISGNDYKVFRAEKSEVILVGKSHQHENGELLFSASDGTLSIKEIQAPSKRRMSIDDFNKGNSL